MATETRKRTNQATVGSGMTSGIVQVVTAVRDDGANYKGTIEMPALLTGEGSYRAMKRTKVVFPIFNEPDGADSCLVLSRGLMYAMRVGAITTLHQALILHLNFMELSFRGLLESMSPALEDLGYVVKPKVNTIRWLKHQQILEEDFDISVSEEKFGFVTAGHVQLTAAICCLLMGKQLTPLNYPNYMKSRVGSFAASCMLNVNDSKLIRMLPDITFCGHVYAAYSSKTPIRRALFLGIQARASNSACEDQQTSKIIMRLLHGAELTNYMLIHEHILLLNPVLFSWNRLAKHAPAVIRAYRVFQALGVNAGYAKFLLDNDALESLSRASLRVPAIVAMHIATKGGNQTLINYRGADSNSQMEALLKDVDRIIAAYNDSETYDTLAVQRVLFPKAENPELIANLRGRIAMVEAEEDEHQRVVPGVI